MRVDAWAHDRKNWVTHLWRSLGWLAVLFLLQISGGWAQAPGRIVSWNLLRYGANSAFCPAACKDAAIGSVLADLQPDLLLAQRVRQDATTFTRLRNLLVQYTGGSWAVLNAPDTTGGRPLYGPCVLYRTTLWQPGTAYLPALGKSPVRQAWVGDLLPTTADANTAPQSGLRLVVAHLHSGSTNGDEATRFAQIDTLLTWLNTQPLPERPTLWAGSLYFRRSSEAGLQQLLDAGLADPTGLTGTWNQRASFAAYHTQSTRLVGESDGGAGGGADSRDDFLLPHARLLATGGDIALQAETYATFGQDGSFFGESILEAKTLSPALREALYFASDHLPVYIDAQVPTQRTPPPTVGSFRVYPNPASQWLDVIPNPPALAGTSLRLLSATGQVVRTWPVGNGTAPTRLSLQGIAPGAYLLQLAHPNLPTQHQRVVVVGE